MKKNYLVLILASVSIGLLCSCASPNGTGKSQNESSVAQETADEGEKDAVTSDEEAKSETEAKAETEARTETKAEADAATEEKSQKIIRSKVKSTDPALEGKTGLELVEALASAGLYPTEADFSEMYESIDDAMADCDAMIEEAKKVQDEYKGKLDNKEAILGALKAAGKDDGVYHKLSKLSAYSNLVNAENLLDSQARKLVNKFNQANTETDNILAFIEAEIYELPIEERQEIFSSPEAFFLGNYSSDYTDPEKKTFDEATSQIINTLEGNEEAPLETFFVLLAENPMPSITTPDGEEKVLTDDVFSELRKSGYDHDFMVKLDDISARRLEKLINTYTSLLQTAMQNNVNDALVNGYDNFLEYALKDDDIEAEIYDRNIESVHNILPYYHRYVDLRKAAISADDGITYLEMLDPTVTSNKNIDYDDAVGMVEEALLVYGDEYIKTYDDMLRKAHINVYPAKNKRTGGFEISPNIPGVYSYIHMNYRGGIKDVRTLAHEGGHAMYENIAGDAINSNIYNYGQIGIFTQEIASTLNEYILLRHLIDEADNDEDKLLYMDTLLTMINETIILQTKYSEFEKYCYERVESGEGLDAEEISDYWYNLEKDYEGDSALVTEGRRYAWAKVHHFYYGYYVYKYATSGTYSGIIANRIFSGDEKIVDEYLDMLALGANEKPSDLLRTIDIDPTEEKAYKEFAELYKGFIDEYEALLKATGRI